MKASHQWAIRFVIAATALLALAACALVWWMPTDQELAARLSDEIEQRLGVKLSIASVAWHLIPVPVITIRDVRTQQNVPVVIGTLNVYPRLRALVLHRQWVFERVELDDAVIPRNSLHALDIKADNLDHVTGDGVPVERVVFRNLNWISYSGVANSFDGEVDFDPHWRPHQAQVRRPDTTPPFSLTATRESDADQWQTQILLGGGTAHGHLVLKTLDDGVMQLSGQLAPRGIEVASALRTFNRRSPVSGRATGQTVVSGGGKTVGQLVRSLHTRTEFSVQGATLLRFDLDKAIHTASKEHDGQTPLQELTGRLDTQNGAEGMRVTGTDIRARAGKFTATGEGTVYHSQIEATGNVDLVEGAIGVPISLSGSVHAPKATVPPGFFAGAAIGTAVLPGIGTAIGARIGGALGKVFGKNAPQETKDARGNKSGPPPK